VNVPANTTDVRVPIKFSDTSATDGSWLVGVAFNTAGLTIEAKRAGDADWTTLAPSVATFNGHAGGGVGGVDCGFVMDAHGDAELQPANLWFASGAQFVLFRVRGVANMQATTARVDLSEADARATLALPNNAAGSPGGLPRMNLLGDESQQGDFTAAQRAYLLEQAALIGTVLIEDEAPTLTLGADITLYADDDNKLALGNAVQFTYSGPLDLGGAAVHFGVGARKPEATALVYVAGAVAAVGDDWSLTFELEATDKALLEPYREYGYTVTVVTADGRRALFEGACKTRRSWVDDGN
jgi:hypothetical protein